MRMKFSQFFRPKETNIAKCVFFFYQINSVSEIVFCGDLNFLCLEAVQNMASFVFLVLRSLTNNKGKVFVFPSF